MDKVVVDDWREAQSGRFGALRRHVDTGASRPRHCTPSWVTW
jgi:alanine dehydrogenase